MPFDESSDSGFAERLMGLLEDRVYFGIGAGSAIATPAQNYGPEGLERKGVYYSEYGEAAPERGQRVGHESGGLRLSSAPERGLSPDGEHAEERAVKLDYPLYAIYDESDIKVVAGEVEVVPEDEWRLFDR
jgi:hypothetical protein